MALGAGEGSYRMRAWSEAAVHSIPGSPDSLPGWAVWGAVGGVSLSAPAVQAWCSRVSVSRLCSIADHAAAHWFKTRPT